MEEKQNLNTSQSSVQVQQPASPVNTSSPDSKFNGKSKILKIIGLIAGVIGLIIFTGFLIIKVFKLGQPEIVTITYWGTWEDQSVMQKIIDDYEVQNPKVKIIYEKQDIEGLGRYTERLKTRIENGTGPDIYSFHSSWVLQLKDYLSVFPEDIVARTQIDTDYYDTVKRDLNYNGGFYGIPLYVDTLALFTNTQLLDNVSLQPPREWNDITRVYNPALLVKDGDSIKISSIAVGTYDNIEHAPDIMASLFLQDGADIYDLNGEKRGDSVSALQFYRSFGSGPSSTWNKTLDNSKTAFAKGSLVMYLGYARDINEIKALNPNLQFQIVEAPRLFDVKSTVASYWAEGVSSKTKHRDVAFEFIEHLSKRETLEKLYLEQEKVRKLGFPYPRKSMQSLLENNDELYPFVSQADDARTTFFSSDTFDGDNGMITRMNSYLGESINGLGESSSASRAIEILAEKVEEALSFYGQ